MAFLPSKRNEDVGFDLYAIHEECFTLLRPGDIKMLRTGLAMEIPMDWVFYITERSSTGSNGMARRCGVIDSGFRGEIFIPINNTSNKNIIFGDENDDDLGMFLKQNKVKRDDCFIYPTTKAIAQGIMLYSPHAEVIEVNELGESRRGDGTLGSTKK